MNSRLGIRISDEIRTQMIEMVHSGKFPNLSTLVRQAIDRFLKNQKEVSINKGSYSNCVY